MGTAPHAPSRAPARMVVPHPALIAVPLPAPAVVPLPVLTALPLPAPTVVLISVPTVGLLPAPTAVPLPTPRAMPLPAPTAVPLPTPGTLPVPLVPISMPTAVPLLTPAVVPRPESAALPQPEPAALSFPAIGCGPNDPYWGVGVCLSRHRRRSLVRHFRSLAAIDYAAHRRWLRATGMPQLELWLTHFQHKPRRRLIKVDGRVSVSDVRRHCGRLRTTVNASQLWKACRRCFKASPICTQPPRSTMEAR